MNTVPKSWVYLAALVLGIAAVGSVVLGATRGGPGRDAVADVGPLSPVPNAAQAKPLAVEAVDEARVREIAREEAQALLSRPAAPKPRPVEKPVDAADDGAASDTGDSATTSGHVSSAPTVRAAPPIGAAPATAASAAGQRALLGGSSRSPSSSVTPHTTPSSSPYPPGSSPD